MNLPKYKNGVIGITLIDDGSFIMFSEDDDMYHKDCMLSKAELLELQSILKKLDEDIKITADFKQRYTKSKKDFFNKFRGSKAFKVAVKDRGKEEPPLISITGIHYSSTFDVSWARDKLALINQVMEINAN